ncbi:amyloid-beta A4 precursor protein-binding family A member 3 [Brienomyrus brachyistius]|uniref:amyloid-beta A4 precursor protein-binding family A member 3 n=1 Tax=Brienomyrus brachyistius TaxID=42636 RepID=UPI0020B2E280|nr:amyloid-beta A4 precursor protein-binding family A member 3 [Brienomyrus brachyistius]
MDRQEDATLEGDVQSRLLVGLRSRPQSQTGSTTVPPGNRPASPGTDEPEHLALAEAVQQDKAVPEAAMAEEECDQTIKGAGKEDSRNPDVEDLDSFNLIEPPPLDWRSDTSSEDASVAGMDDSRFLPSDTILDVPENSIQDSWLFSETKACVQEPGLEQDGHQDSTAGRNAEKMEDEKEQNVGYKPGGGSNHFQIDEQLDQLQVVMPTPHYSKCISDISCSASLNPEERTLAHSEVNTLPENEEHQCSGLLFSESHQKDLLGLLDFEEKGSPSQRTAGVEFLSHRNEIDAVLSVSYSEEEGQRFWDCFADARDMGNSGHTVPGRPDPLTGESTSLEDDEAAAPVSSGNSECHPAYKDVPGPCDPEDLLDGVIFGAKYLGSTQLMSEKNPSTNVRMAQAQEAVDRIKAPEGESQPMTEVDLFVSTQRIKVLSTDTQEAMMDHSLQMISYIADIGPILVLMARRKPPGRKGAADGPESNSQGPRKNCCMICHVFSSDDAQVIAQAMGQAFGVAYQQFLQANGIKASDLRPGEYSDYLGTHELYNGDLVHFSRSENMREVCISKAPGEILGLAVVESGWGSILPTVVVANLLHGGPAERSGELNIGDRIMSVNGTSLVGLPISTCHSIIRDLKNTSDVNLSIVRCPPVTMAIIRRPDPKYQLGFSVEDGIICSLMRGGIAERGGIRVGHRIIEINGQSVVATAHEKIIHLLSHAVGEIHLKTMPASTYRLLTGQEHPLYL